MAKRSTSLQKPQLDARTLRYILSAALVIILAGMAAGFYATYSALQGVATDVAKVQSDANSSDAKLQHLMQLEKQLEQHAETAERAQRIVAESQDYRYQEQIINELTQYAQQAGLGISSFTFQAGSDGAAGTQAPPPANADSAPVESADGTETAPAQSPAPAAPSVKSTQVSVQLSGDIQYQNLLHFIYLIERNLTRMQISDLTLSGGGEGSTISAQTLNIEVYIR